MVEQNTSAAAAPRGQDPAARARDQLGALFFVLAIALACGAVAAARDPHGTYFRHAVWWWVGWALLMYTPALVFTLLPWTMRTVLRMPPGRAVDDALRAFYGLLGFVAVLALGDAVVLGSFSEFPAKVPAGLILLLVVAPCGATPSAIAVLRGRQAWLPVLLPLAILLNALLVEWVAGFFGKSLIS
ncbi:MAG: hypothetical protein AAB074_12545 [Planctomycetota bacterium]